MKIEYKYLRKEKAEAMQMAYQCGIQLNNDIKAEKYNAAVILPGKQPDSSTGGGLELGGVIDEFGKHVELSKNSAYFLGGIYETKILRQSKKTVVYCGYLGYGHHWGHFLIDIVPRLWYALEADEKIDEYIMICEDGNTEPLEGNIYEFLQLLGISDKTRLLTEPTRFHKVIVPQLSYSYVSIINSYKEKYYSPKYIRTLDYVIEKALAICQGEDTGSKKVFLSRSALPCAKERDCGIEIIDSFFENNGYCIMFPEKISLKQFIYIINQCSMVACIQGTVGHNLLFIKNSINVISIERHAGINYVQNDINMMRGLNVAFIDANYCILPVVPVGGPFIYAYNTYLALYAKDMKMNLPGYQYITNEYRNKIIVKYLENYRMPSLKTEWRLNYHKPTETEWEMNARRYIVIAHNESIQDLSPDFQFLLYKTLSEISNKCEISRRVIKCLMAHNFIYSEWRHTDVYQGFVKVIQEGIACNRTEFLIYPFGRNGLLFKQILNEQYGIEEKAIFDNVLCQFNKRIKPIKEIEKYYNDHAYFVLTSNKVECRRELEKYCETDIVSGPFSFQFTC